MFKNLKFAAIYASFISMTNAHSMDLIDSLNNKEPKEKLTQDQLSDKWEESKK